MTTNKTHNSIYNQLLRLLNQPMVGSGNRFLFCFFFRISLDLFYQNFLIINSLVRNILRYDMWYHWGMYFGRWLACRTQSCTNRICKKKKKLVLHKITFQENVKRSFTIGVNRAEVWWDKVIFRRVKNFAEFRCTFYWQRTVSTHINVHVSILNDFDNIN